MENRQHSPRTNPKQNAYGQRQRRKPHNNRRSYNETAREYYGSDDNNFQYIDKTIKVNRNKLLLGLGATILIIGAASIGILISNIGKVEIVSAQPYSVSAQQPYKNCEKVKTTHYVKNHKSGTEGAVIGGVGGAAVGGLISHSWIGAGVGAAVGAVGGDLIERRREPNYVAHHDSTDECQIEYRGIMVPVGYQVEYLQGNQPVQIITQHQPLVGTKVSLKDLQQDEVTPARQQELIQHAIKVTESQSAETKN